MRDEASLRRLAEMDIDVYVPRAAARHDAPAPAPVAAARPAPPAGVPALAPAPAAAVDALLLADAADRGAEALLGDVVRALAFARITAARSAAADEAALTSAAALVAFGEAQARAAGAALPAQRQREIGWVVAGDPAALVGDAAAKRALWSELRRMLRGLRARRHAGA
jgi:hypothetical protein